MVEVFLAAFATLFVIVDPIGLTPMFAALTAGESQSERLVIAIRGSLVAFVLLILFGLFGDWLIKTLGISLSAFQVAGGLMLFLVAVEMLFQKRTERREAEAGAANLENDPSVFPLAIPLMAGPGALATMILLASEAQGVEAVLVYGAACVVVLLCFIAFLSTGLIERVLGDVGIRVLTRVFGMLLGALSVQFIADGLIGLFPVIAG